MDQKRPVFITSEESVKPPLLIVDKEGLIGCALVKRLRDQFLVVVVTAHSVERHHNVIHVPYRKKIPMIPDNAYSHIFVVYNDEKELLEMLSAFEEKAEAVKARFLFITSLLYSSPSLFTRLQRAELRLLQSVLVGEIFENTITQANETNYFVHQARVYGRIEVPKEGLGQLYPVFLDDVVAALVTLAFAIERPKGPILLFPHHIFNQITVARIIQKINPLIKVDFSKRKSILQKYYFPKNGLYFFKNYNIEERLHKLDLARTGRRLQLPQKKIHFKPPRPQKEHHILEFFVAILLAVFIAPLIIILLSAFLGAGLEALSIKQAEQGSFSSAATTASIAQEAFSLAQNVGSSLFYPQFILPQQNQQMLQFLFAGETIASTEVSFFHVVEEMKNIYEGKSIDPQGDFLQAQTTLKEILLTMQKLEAENILPQMMQNKIHSFDGITNVVEETIDAWPKIFGFQGKRTYLILFQNNMELRPGGGFIGSYGILTVDNGKISPLQIHDVYDADGHLTETIQPPYGLQRYLGSSHWFLRDSTFDVDFVNDAKQASFFLKKETGQSVDGVVAINTTFLKNLISVIGSVAVPDYHVTVTPDNFYLLTETNAEKNFFPGSTQKKDFLRSLTNALFYKLIIEKTIPYEKYAQMVLSSLMQKDLLFAFSDPAVQNVFTVNGLSSSLWDGRKATQNTALDFNGVVDANVGQNKANYYIKRSLSQSTTIDDAGGQQTTLEAIYTNTSTRASAFGGDYKDYVRFIVPANANLLSVSFNDKQAQTVPAITDPGIFKAVGFIPPAGLEVDQNIEQQKRLIGFFFIVPQDATRNVSITYSLPSGITPNAVAFTYSLLIFKQPGSGDDPYHLSLSYPNDVTVVANNKALTNVGGKLLYDGQLTGDKTLSAIFSRK